MQIPVQHSSKSLREAQRMQTAGWRRGLRGLRYARIMIYGLIGLWVGAGMVLKGAVTEPRNTHDIGTGLALISGIVALAVILYWRSQTATARGLAAQVPATLDVTAAGVSSYSATSASDFTPWTSFTSFREGKHATLLARAGKLAPIAIPTEGLDEATRGSLRSLLLSNLPEKR